MAVEFRSRIWFTTENLHTTLDWLKKHNIGLVVADELQNELYVEKNKSAEGQGKGSGRGGVVPIIMALGSCDFAYVRVHRRVGKHRVLSEEEIKSWGERIRLPELQNSLQGPIYFMWGTDHEDQPIINSKNLTKEIGSMAYDWKSKISNTGMLRFCSRVPTTSDEQKKESSVSRNSALNQKDLLDTVAIGKGDEVRVSETISFATMESRESESKRPISPLEESKLCSSGMATKRTSSRAGLISPKKKYPASPISKNQKKCTTPNNQRIISDFFKK